MGAAQVVVVGAGQAGLAVSRALTTLGVDHLILERDRVAQSWRGRWDSFSLVTPNWTLNLPGLAYDGPDPEGHVTRDEIVDFFERYAAACKAPVQAGVNVTRLRSAPGGFRLTTSAGDVHATHVVLTTGAFQKPHRPAFTGEFPARLLVIDAEEYRHPGMLPTGGVLVVGSGQTGCQLSEELCDSGREVFLACGRAPWIPRRAGGRDMVSWMNETSWFDFPNTALPTPGARLIANFQMTGRDGGHDLTFRTLQEMGVHLLGHLRGVEAGRARFAPDLADSVAFGDARYAEVCAVLREQLPSRGLPVPELLPPPPFRADPALEIDLDGIETVIFTSGFRPDYSSWVELPAFDGLGFPITDDGASTVVPGLYFAGVHFMRKRKSSLIFGVGEDAELVARAVAAAA